MLTIIDGFAAPSSHPGAIPSPRVGVLERAARTQVPCPRWRLAGDGRTSAEAADEGELITDDRCPLSPEQMVEDKLTRALMGWVPVSHCLTRGLLRSR